MAMIIGCTIKEAQQRVSISEFDIWIRYRRKFGPMNPVRRYDVGSAMISAIIANSHGRRSKTSDFLTYGKEEEEDIIVDEDGFLKALGGKAKHGR